MIASGLLMTVFTSSQLDEDPHLTETEALAALEKLGARFNPDDIKAANERPIKGIQFGKKSQHTDADLKYLQYLPALEYVYVLRQKGVTGEGLKFLARLKRLHTIDLDGSAIESRHLVHIKPITSLWRLGLWRTNIDDAGLVYLKDLPNLQRLYLEHTRVGDAGIISLGQHPALRVVWTQGSRVTEKGHTFMKANFANFGKESERPK